MNRLFLRPINILKPLIIAALAVHASAATAADEAPTIYKFTVKDINSKDVALKSYQGKVLLLVNTASYCGFTSQYKSLEGLFKKFKDRGFFVLGFPSNDFGSQEPGSNKEIKNFCELNYKVSFPLFAKVAVSGAGKVPLFKFLTEESGAAFNRPIDWNFEKFLISRNGHLIARFKSIVDPLAPEMLATIEKELQSKSH